MGWDRGNREGLSNRDEGGVGDKTGRVLNVVRLMGVDKRRLKGDMDMKWTVLQGERRECEGERKMDELLL